MRAYLVLVQQYIDHPWLEDSLVWLQSAAKDVGFEWSDLFQLLELETA
jgi:hypothetical protein